MLSSHPVRSLRSTPPTMSAAAASTTIPSLPALADPQPRLMDAAAMEYFLVEAVHTLRQSSAVADSRAQKIEDEMVEAGLIPPPPPSKGKAKKDAQRDSVSIGPLAPSEDEEEGLRARLEAIGMHVGANITERCACISCCRMERIPTCKAMPWPGWVRRHPGHRKICMQRAVVNMLGQTSRQPPNKPPSEILCSKIRLPASFLRFI